MRYTVVFSFVALGLLAACGGGSGAAPYVAPPQDLAAPAGVGLDAAEQQLTVSWDTVPAASGYHVYLAAAAGITAEGIDAMPGGRVVTVTDATTFTFAGLEAGTTWCCRVDAYDAARRSDLSEEVAALLPPSAPTGLAVVAADQAVRLQWNPAPGATAYDVYVAASPDLTSATWAILPAGVAFPDAVSPLVVTGLENDVPVYLVVVARNASGPSADSQVVSATPVAPLMVEDLSGSEGPGEVTITWSDLGEGATYVLYVATEPGVTSENWESLEGGQRFVDATSPFTLSDLDAGTTVYFVVTVLDAGVEGPASEEASATPNGRGTFSAGVAPSVGAGPVDLALADLDGDGALDVVTADRDDETLTVLPGQGDGHFGTAVTVDLGSAPGAVSVGDVDGDGVPDLAVSLPDEGAVVVLAGDGSLGFTEAVRLDTDDAAGRVQLVDLDGDGALDLLASIRDAGEVQVWLGDGEGGFDATDAVGTSVYPGGFSLGDLDGDGVLDLAVANTGDNSVSLFVGLGDGTFTSWTSLGAAPELGDVSLADVDGDGTPEVLPIAGSIAMVECFAIDAAGDVERVAGVPAGLQPSGVAVADLDGDGTIDVLVLNRGENGVSVLRGGSGLEFTPRQRIDQIANPTGRVFLVDLDGDGLLDAVYASEPEGRVQVLLGNS